MDKTVQPRSDPIETRFQNIDKRFDDLKWYLAGSSAFFTIAFAVLSFLAAKQNDNIAKQGDTLNAAIARQTSDLHQFERDSVEDGQKSFDRMRDEVRQELTITSDGIRDYRSTVDGVLVNKSSEIRRAEDDMKAELRLREEPPIIEMLGTNGKSLTGQTITVQNNPLIDDYGKLVPNGHVISFAILLRNTGKSMSGPIFLKAYSDEIPFPYQVVDGGGSKYSTVLDQSRIRTQIPGGGFTMPEFWNLTVDSSVSRGRHPMILSLYYDGFRVTEAHVFAEVP
jgi:hypothetical protein